MKFMKTTGKHGGSVIRINLENKDLVDLAEVNKGSNHLLDCCASFCCASK